jgi:hypothetical protein
MVPVSKERRADPDQLSLMTLGDEVLEQVCIPLASTPQIERALGECLPKDLPIQTQFLLVAVLEVLRPYQLLAAMRLVTAEPGLETSRAFLAVCLPLMGTEFLLLGVLTLLNDFATLTVAE